MGNEFEKHRVVVYVIPLASLADRQVYTRARRKI